MRRSNLRIDNRIGKTFRRACSNESAELTHIARRSARPGQRSRPVFQVDEEESLRPVSGVRALPTGPVQRLGDGASVCSVFFPWVPSEKEMNYVPQHELEIG